MTALMSLTRDGLLQQKRKLNGTTESGDPGSSVALQPPAMISEYLSAMQAKSFSDMSALELQDRHILGTCVLGNFSRGIS